MGLKLFLEDLLGRRVDLVTKRALRHELRVLAKSGLVVGSRFNRAERLRAPRCRPWPPAGRNRAIWEAH